MRIVIVSNLYPPHVKGGYEIRCQQTAEALAAAGHDVWVLTSDFGLRTRKRSWLSEGALAVERPTRDGGERSGVVVHRDLDIYAYGPQPVGRPWSLIRARRELRDARRFAGHLRRIRPDVVNWWSMNGLAKVLLPLPGAMGIPDVHWIEHPWMIQELGPGSGLVTSFWDRFWSGRWLPRASRAAGRAWLTAWRKVSLRRGIRTTDLRYVPTHMIFVSRYMQRIHEEAGFAFPSVEVIHGGVPAQTYARAGLERAPAPSTLRLLFASQMTHDRGLHTLIEALEMNASANRGDFRLTVVGATSDVYRSYREEQERRVRAGPLRARVRFLGQLPHDRMAALYRDHDLLVFPSMRPEGLPLSMVEAMLAGCAVITSGSGGAIEVAEAADLPTFPPGDALALADLLADLGARPDRVEALAVRSRDVALRQFTLERMIRDLTRTLEELALGADHARGEEAGRRSVSGAQRMQA